MTPDNSPSLGGQSDVTGREPELSGARDQQWILGDTCKCDYCEYLRRKPAFEPSDLPAVPFEVPRRSIMEYNE